MPKKRQSTQKNNFFKSIFILILLIVIGSSGLFLFSEFKKPTRTETVRVGLAWLNQAQFAGIYTAIEKGFYEDVGLDIKLEEFNKNESQEEKLISGELDFTVSQPIVLINNVAEGLEIKAIAAIYQTSPLVFLHKRELKLDGPDDFKGKTLGFKGDSLAGKLLFTALLSELGLKNDDVNFKRLDFTTHEFDDVQNKTVDIIGLYRTNQPYTFNKKGVDYSLILPEDFRFDMYGDVLATSNEMIKNNPKLVQNFVDATLKGWEYAIENQGEAIEFTKKYITSEAYQEEEYNEFILKESSLLIDVFGAKEIGYMRIEKWNSLYEAMLGSNTIEKEFDVQKLFTTEFLD